MLVHSTICALGCAHHLEKNNLIEELNLERLIVFSNGLDFFVNF